MPSEPSLGNSDEDAPRRLLETQAVVEQAKGILMATYRCGPEEAFDLLRRASQGRHVKIHVLARRLVEKASHGVTIT